MENINYLYFPTKEMENIYIKKFSCIFFTIPCKY